MLQLSADDRIEALYEADRLWELGVLEDDYYRARSAKGINYCKLFSLDQLAQIARVPKKVLTDLGVEEYAERAGKLNPESIRTIRLLELNYRTQGKVSMPLVGIVLRDGTSLQAIHQLTGIPKKELEEK